MQKDTPEKNFERRIEIIELRNSINISNDLAGKTLKMVEGIQTTLHGEGENPGFIGNTQTKLAVNEKSIGWLRGITCGICMLLVANAVRVIFFGP